MELLTVKEAAEFLRVPKNTLISWLSNGTIPKEKISCKIGARRIFQKDKLIKFVQSKFS